MGANPKPGGEGICNVPDLLGSDWEGGVKPKLKDGIPKSWLSNGSIVGCPPPDPSPLSTSTCPGSICSCMPGKGGIGGRPPLAPRPGCLRAPLLTPRAPDPVRVPKDGYETVVLGMSVGYRAVMDCSPKYRQ
ncbi:hypothetical protein M9H77_18970 [Catharanthus roseus]|uniref:Uncharacterized protein n=1 Tax=Catharanthus roseus TaxID=4058 RepID=A0ACC0B924_CATRO|nr:hypothetical protein M9H77_18970 [Catharanthus roseus]